ncbi:MAG: hypothetical protein KDC54_11270 [Lewinella sp.]|nr:hypothetical protein [Lewinella sp.]
MKRIALIAALLSCSLTGFSQVFMNFEVGYNGQFGSPEGLNYIVQRYNETRNFLTDEMKPFNHMNGLAVSLGFVYGAYIDVGFIGRSQKRFATATVNGEDLKRYLRLRNNGLSLGIGIPLIADHVKIIPGARVDFVFPRISSKVESDNPSYDEDWEDLYTGTSTYIAPFLKIILGPVNLEPYYAFGDRKLGNIAKVNEELNPNTYTNDPIDIPFNHRGFGFRLTLSLSGYADPG